MYVKCISTIHINNSMIFRTITKDSTGAINQIGILGKSIHDIKRDLSSGQGKLFSVFGGNLVTSKDISAIQQYTNLVKSGVPIGKAWIDTMTGCSVAAKQQVLQCKNNITSLKELTVAQKANTLSTKAAALGMKALSIAGNIILFMAITKGIQLAAKAIDDYVHRLDNAKEALNETKSELESVNSEIGETTDKIKELEALEPSSLSITDKEDLQRLKDQNKELRIRQQYLEQQEKADLQKVADLTKEKYGLKYNDSASREDIDAYKELYEKPSKQSKPASTYLTGTSSDQATPYAAGLQNQDIMKGSDSLASLIAQYEYFEEQKKKAIQSKDVESIDKYNQKIEEIAQKLRDDRIELQGFSDDLSATGESSAELDDINSKLKLIDDTLLIKGQNLVNFINSDAIADDKEKLVELANSGKLTADVLSNKFSDVDQYLKDNGLTLEDLISIIKTYKEELANLPNNETANLTPTISSSISQLATQLEPQFAELGEAYKAIFTDEGFTLDDVDNSMLEKLRQSFAEIEEKVGVAFDATKLDPFFDTLTNGSSTAEQVQQAFNHLATAYFYSTDTLEQLNAETADAIEKQLEEMGVVNAKEVVYDTLNAKTEALALQEQFLAENGYALINASNDKVIGFLNEAGASETTRAYLFQLVATEQVFNAQGLDVSGKIEKLKELATAYGQAAIAAKITHMEDQNAKAHTSFTGSDYQSLINEVNSAINNVQIDFSGVGGGAKSAGSAGSEAGDEYVKAFEEELSHLTDLRDRGIIDESEYLSRLRELYQRYFKDRKEYLDEYNKYERQYLEGKHTCPLLQ